MYSVRKESVKNKEFTLIEVSRKTIKMTFMDYGAAVLSIHVPDSFGKMETVLLAYEKLDSYIENSLCLNATIGPISGRISNAKFKINDIEYSLEKNFLGTTNLHGGSECFAYKIFDYKIIETSEKTQLIFTYKKEEGYLGTPGNQDITITYDVYDSYYSVDFNATTDKDTLLNLTNHNYFNLSGNLRYSILGHILKVNSSKYFSLDDSFVPEKIRFSKDTAFDFTKETLISENLTKELKELKEKGIDHPFILEKTGIEYPQVIYKDPISRRRLDIYTSYPCIVIYTHNHIDDKKILFNTKHKEHMGICFETQYVPNGINMIDQDNSILKKKEVYSHKTIYKFSTY